MHGLGDIREARLTDVVVRPVALCLDGPDIPEYGMLEFWLQPEVRQVIVPKVGEVDMGIDQC